MSDSESEVYQDESEDFVESEEAPSEEDDDALDDGDDGDDDGGDEDDFGTPRKKPAKAAKAKPTATAAKKTPAKKASAGRATKPSSPAKGAAAATAVTAAVAAAAPAQSAAPKMAIPKAVRTEAEAERVILDYMTRQNRPYSVGNVFDNLHKAVAKPVAQRVLDKLADKGDLIKKEYGKAVIYCVNQDRLGSDFSPAEMAALAERENEGKRKYAEVSAEAAALSKELAALTAEPTDSELDSELARLQAEADTKLAKVGSLSGAKPADPKQRAKALADFKKFRTAWVERKRKATDFLEVLSENMNKKMKDVVELMGLETDEAVGAKLPDLL